MLKVYGLDWPGRRSLGLARFNKIFGPAWPIGGLARAGVYFGQISMAATHGDGYIYWTCSWERGVKCNKLYYIPHTSQRARTFNRIGYHASIVATQPTPIHKSPLFLSISHNHRNYSQPLSQRDGHVKLTSVAGYTAESGYLQIHVLHHAIIYIQLLSCSRQCIITKTSCHHR